MAGYPAWDQDSARMIVAGLAHLEGATLPMLHALQDEFGYVDPQAVPLIAEALNLSRAEVHGAISFYHDFKTAPQPARTIKLCRAEACQTMGADAMAEHACRTLGLDWHETSKAGRVTLEPIFCLGLCACGPAAMVDGKLVGRLDEAKLDKIIGGLR